MVRRTEPSSSGVSTTTHVLRWGLVPGDPQDMLTIRQTFEGHTNSVLRVDFLTNGMQLVTSASDGLVKLWNIKDEQCVKTLDNHEDKACCDGD